MDKNVDTVQWLRGIAAMMVVVHHAKNPSSWLFNPIEQYPAFAWGVDIFFAISGFILFVATRNEPPIEFMKRRIARVVPLYWLATTILLLVSSRQFIIQLSPLELNHLINSFLFVPHFNPSYPEKIWPYLIPGWTLNYEMFFYLVFFTGLLMKRPLEIVSITILFLVIFGLVQPNNGDPLWKTYTNPLMLEFLVGTWIGKIYISKKLDWQFAFLFPIGLIGLFVLPLATDEIFWTGGRLIFSTFILVGTVSFASYAPKVPFLQRLGDASYSIYLSHTVLGLWLSNKLVSHLPLNGWNQLLFYILFSLAVCGFLGYVIHLVIEKPLLKAVRSRIFSKNNLTLN